MTAAEFKKAQLRLGLTNQAMAELLRCSGTHLENLRRGHKQERGSQVEVLASPMIERIIEQAEELRRLKAT